MEGKVEKIEVSEFHKNMIINAIRVLRVRRVRPNMKKISWLVGREHKIELDTLQSLVEALVENKDILRVHFKGAISYRVPPRADAPFEDSLLDAESDLNNSNFPQTSGGQLSSDSDLDGDSETPGSDSASPRLTSIKQHEQRKPRRGAPSGMNFRQLGTVSSRGGRDSGVMGGSAPKPRLHASPAVRDTNSISDTISRVIMAGGGNNNHSSSSSSRASSGNGSVTPKSGRSTPTMGGSEEENCEMQCFEFETPCSRPAAIAPRGTARRGRPPLSSLGLGESRRPRAPSARAKRAKRVYDPSEGSLVELPGSSPVLNGAAPPAAVAGGPTIPVGTPTTPVGGPTATTPAGASVVAPFRSNTNKRRHDMHGEMCDICMGTGGLDTGDDFVLRCSSCSATGHPSCLGYSAELAERSRRQTWTCMDCKQCTICDMDHLIGTLIFCDECDRAYHLTCHQPPLTTQPRGTWVCCYCNPTHHNGYEGGLYPPGQGPFPLTPRDSPVPDDESRGSSGSWQPQQGSPSLVYDPSIPIATHWTVEEVAVYFQDKGFTEEAAVLKEQVVDGSALLLVSRSDVLQGLGLKLGPALKLYRQVRILQTRLPNPPLLC